MSKDNKQLSLSSLGLEIQQPQKRNRKKTKLDLIYTKGYDGEWACCIAVRCGWMYGVQSDKRFLDNPDIKFCPRVTSVNSHKIVFVDNDYSNYNHDLHLKCVKEVKPKYATVRDIMSKDQCQKSNIEYFPFEQILDWAEEINQFAENVIVIPKYNCLDKIPKKFMLGYSVPTSHGGTPLLPEIFKGRRIHLLGGSWKEQLRHVNMLGDDVVSLDNNYIHKQAKYGSFVWPNGETDVVSRFFPQVTNPLYVALSISFGNVIAKIRELENLEEYKIKW